MSSKSNNNWELKRHSHQIEITNGKISLLTNDDDDEALQSVVDALNASGCTSTMTFPKDLGLNDMEINFNEVDDTAIAAAAKMMHDWLPKQENLPDLKSDS